MKYYDSTSMRMREITEDNFVPTSHLEKVTNAKSILLVIAGVLMIACIVLQLFWFNIILFSILCSAVVALCTAILVCDIMQKDFLHACLCGLWLFVWALNLITNLLEYFVW